LRKGHKNTDDYRERSLRSEERLRRQPKKRKKGGWARRLFAFNGGAATRDQRKKDSDACRPRTAQSRRKGWASKSERLRISGDRRTRSDAQNRGGFFRKSRGSRQASQNRSLERLGEREKAKVKPQSIAHLKRGKAKNRMVEFVGFIPRRRAETEGEGAVRRLVEEKKKSYTNDVFLRRLSKKGK